jgi:hypothetical protein
MDIKDKADGMGKAKRGKGKLRDESDDNEFPESNF